MRTYEYIGKSPKYKGKICVYKNLEHFGRDPRTTLWTVEFLGGEQAVVPFRDLKPIEEKEEVFIVKEERTGRLAGGDNPIYSNYNDAVAKAKNVATQSGKTYLVLKAVAKVGPEKPRIKVEEL